MRQQIDKRRPIFAKTFVFAALLCSFNLGFLSTAVSEEVHPTLLQDCEIVAEHPDYFYRHSLSEEEKQNPWKAVIADCSKNGYFHYFRPKFQKSETVSLHKDDIKIAGFNAYHLGDNQGVYKRADIFAQMLNQWDVIAVTEITPMGEGSAHSKIYSAKRNRRLHAILQRYGDLSDDETPGDQYGDEIPFTKKELKHSLSEPTYIQILSALHKLDKSWGLIISSGISGGEAQGVFYRGSAVEPTAAEACGEDLLACYAPLYELDLFYSREEVHEFFGRVPFISSFQARSDSVMAEPFKFSLVSVHQRFRFDRDEGVGEGEDLFRRVVSRIESTDESGMVFVTKDDKSDIRYGDIYTGDPGDSSSLLMRFAETQWTVDLVEKLIGQYVNEDDFIILGDFNILASKEDAEHLPEDRQTAWAAALYSSESAFQPSVYQYAPTTVKGGHLLSNGEVSYLNGSVDHFIFDPKATSECDPETVNAFDFTTKFSPLLNFIDEIAEDSDDYYEETAERYFRSILRVYARGDTLEESTFQVLPPLKEDVEEMEVKFLRRVIERAERFSEVHAFSSISESDLNGDYWKIFYELIGDHLPIVMSCNTSED